MGNLCYQEFSNNSSLSFVCNLCYQELSNNSSLSFVFFFSATRSLVITPGVHLWVTCATRDLVKLHLSFEGNMCYQEFSNNSSLSFVGNLCYQEFSNNSSLSFVGNFCYQELSNNSSLSFVGN